MAEPVDTAKRRRRWPWVVLVAALLLIGGPVAWKFRPLTATERQLVGTWAESDPIAMRYTFRPDRTFLMTFPRDQPLSQEVEIALGAGGKWQCSGGQLLLRFDENDSTTILETIRGLFRGTFIVPDRGDDRDNWDTLRFDEDGNAWIGLSLYTRIVSDARVAR